jgi:GNAT superfamily N-acetyltransferase
MIIKATEQDAKKLTELTFKSKAFWGYSTALMELWKEELTINAAYFEEYVVYKSLENDRITAFCSYKIEVDCIYLDMFFVDPEFIGKGYGHALIVFLKSHCKGLGSYIELHADPHATAFYIKNGFEITGKMETKIKDRHLPVMQYVW